MYFYFDIHELNFIETIFDVFERRNIFLVAIFEEKKQLIIT